MIIDMNTRLPATAGKANSDLVETLENLLDRAKSGAIVGCGFAICNGDGSVGTMWAGGELAVEMMAATALLHRDFLAGVMLD